MSGALNGASKKRSAVYEQYLNIKQSAIPHSPSQPTGGGASSSFSTLPLPPPPSAAAATSATSDTAAASPAMTMQEITNSTGA
ncbi:hypothetical protein Gpo141_00004514 [Globisporangium polare]